MDRGHSKSLQGTILTTLHPHSEDYYLEKKTKFTWTFVVAGCEKDGNWEINFILCNIQGVAIPNGHEFLEMNWKWIGDIGVYAEFKVKNGCAVGKSCSLVVEVFDAHGRMIATDTSRSFRTLTRRKNFSKKSDEFLQEQENFAKIREQAHQHAVDIIPKARTDVKGAREDLKKKGILKYPPLVKSHKEEEEKYSKCTSYRRYMREVEEKAEEEDKKEKKKRKRDVDSTSMPPNPVPTKKKVKKVQMAIGKNDLKKKNEQENLEKPVVMVVVDDPLDIVPCDEDADAFMEKLCNACMELDTLHFNFMAREIEFMDAWQQDGKCFDEMIAKVHFEDEPSSKL